MRFDTLFSQMQRATTPYGSVSKAAQSVSGAQQYIQPRFSAFLRFTLMFTLLPMVTFEHTIFHVESCYRNMW